MRPTKIDYLNLASSVKKTATKNEIEYVADRLMHIRRKRHCSFEQLRDWVLRTDKKKLDTAISEVSFDEYETNKPRFSVAKYISTNGKRSWGIWDNARSEWSRWVFHGIYPTKKEAEWRLKNMVEPTDEDIEACYL